MQLLSHACITIAKVLQCFHKVAYLLSHLLKLSLKQSNTKIIKCLHCDIDGNVCRQTCTIVKCLLISQFCKCVTQILQI